MTFVHAPRFQSRGQQKPNHSTEIVESSWKTDGVWISTRQVAEILGVTMRRVHKLAEDRGLAGFDIGSMRVWSTEQVRKMAPR